MWPFNPLTPHTALRELLRRVRAASAHACVEPIRDVAAAGARLASRALTAWRRRVEHRRAREELMCWSDQELSDIGIRRDEIARFVSTGRIAGDAATVSAAPTGGAAGAPPPPRRAARPTVVRYARPVRGTDLSLACC